MHFSLKNIPQCKKNLKNQSPTLFLQKINHCLSLQTKNYQSKQHILFAFPKKKESSAILGACSFPFFPANATKLPAMH
jgi:hypothetical protein